MALCAVGRRRGAAALGRTVLKRRLLAALGWRLLEVPFWEWDPLGAADRTAEHDGVGDSEEQCEYLRERLQRLRGVDDSSRRDEPSQSGGAAASAPRESRWDREAPPAAAVSDILAEDPGIADDYDHEPAGFDDSGWGDGGGGDGGDGGGGDGGGASPADPYSEVVRAEAAASARRRSGGGGGADDDGAEWLESFSDKHARPFWKLLTTGERTWKRPLGAKVRVHEKKRKRR